MKEAVGELNMTVITVVAIAAVAAFFYFLIWPSIQVSIANSQCEATCGDGNFTPATRANLNNEGSQTGSDSVNQSGWVCDCN